MGADREDPDWAASALSLSVCEDVATVRPLGGSRLRIVTEVSLEEEIPEDKRGMLTPTSN